MNIVPSRGVRESDAFLYRATIPRKFVAYAESHRQGRQKEVFGIEAVRVPIV